MKIEFDTETMTQAEARGLVALFREQFPDIAAAWKTTETARYTAPASQVLAQSLNAPEWAAPAPDGYPVVPTPPVSAPVVDDAAAEAPERDVAGIPWDERIHASTKTTNKDGTWTRRRNTPDATFDAVMAELKARNTVMTMAAAGGLIDKVGTLEMGIPTPEPTAAEAFTPPPSVVIAPTVPQPPVVPTPPAPDHVEQAAQNAVARATTAVADAAAEPVAIMRVLSDKRVAGDTLAAVLAKAGLPGLAGVFTAPIEARRIIAAELAVL